MTGLSVDYAGLAAELSRPITPARVGFDLASAVGAEQEDRTVAAWTVTPATVARRDVSYQRGYPLAAEPDSLPVDRGHLIPHLSGGEFGPNIFRQGRALNRGWSPEGKRYRALEREAAANPGSNRDRNTPRKNPTRRAL
jgi:hypothetical protein